MRRHWLTTGETIRRLWIAMAILLALTVLAEPFVTHAPHFAVEAVFGFNAWYGFLACAVLILFAKLLGAALKRPDAYYENDDG